LAANYKIILKSACPGKNQELLARTIPGKPKSSKQEYLTTDKGSVFLEMLKAKY